MQSFQNLKTNNSILSNIEFESKITENKKIINKTLVSDKTSIDIEFKWKDENIKNVKIFQLNLKKNFLDK